MSIYQTLKTHFGFEAFRPLQEEIIHTVLKQQDALVVMPTGGGKSLCYQLPALMQDGVTLVISPLIALMKDQVDALRANGIASAFLNSSLNREEMTTVQEQSLRGEIKLLYLSPERLSTPGFQTFLTQVSVSLIAIDEAHCISEWGHDFRPDYRQLVSLRKLFPDVALIALTATATERVRQDILRSLAMEHARVFLSSFNRENLFYRVREKLYAFDQLFELISSYQNKSIIIYCFSRKQTDDLAADLRDHGYQALAYHAGLSPQVRKNAQEQFIHDEVQIMVATIAFGMGIDKPDVRLVVHMDLPKTIEGYYQETGRAGRDGMPSECVLFYTYADVRKQEYFLNQIDDDQERALAFTKLRQVIDYGEHSACRRYYLLSYFGEQDVSRTCTACDHCMTEQTLHDATQISQKILSAVLRTQERFGIAYVCDVLRGSRKKRVLENHHDRLSVFGLLKDLPLSELREFFGLLIKSGYLFKASGEYPVVQVSELGRMALKDRTQILLPKSEPVRVAVHRADVEALAYEHELFEQLRQMRKQLADEQNVPPFVIFGDKTLQEMAYYLPSTLEAFGTLFGVGEKKRDQYGERFLTQICTFAQLHGLSERERPINPSVQKRVRVQKSVRETRGGSTYDHTRVLLEQKFTISQIAGERGLSFGTIIQHVVKLAQAYPDLDLNHLKPPPERFEKICAAFRDCGSIYLTPVKEQLGDNYSYDELHLARIFLNRH